MEYGNQGEPWDEYEQGYNEARADLIMKLRAKIRRRELSSVKAVDAWLEGRVDKARRSGRWPDGWE